MRSALNGDIKHAKTINLNFVKAILQDRLRKSKQNLEKPPIQRNQQYANRGKKPTRRLDLKSCGTWLMID